MAAGTDKDKHIREVWADNLEEEMETMRALIETYPYLSMVRGRNAPARPSVPALTNAYGEADGGECLGHRVSWDRCAAHRQLQEVRARTLCLPAGAACV